MVCLDGFDPFGILSVGFSTIVNCGWLLVCMHGTLYLSAMKRPLLISISCFFTRMLLVYPKKSLRVFNVDALYAIIRILKYRFCKLLSYLVDSGYHFYKYNVLCFGWQTHIMRSKAERKGERRYGYHVLVFQKLVYALWKNHLLLRLAESSNRPSFSLLSMNLLKRVLA